MYRPVGDRRSDETSNGRDTSASGTGDTVVTTTAGAGARNGSATNRSRKDGEPRYVKKNAASANDADAWRSARRFSSAIAPASASTGTETHDQVRAALCRSSASPPTTAAATPATRTRPARSPANLDACGGSCSRLLATATAASAIAHTSSASAVQSRPPFSHRPCSRHASTKPPNDARLVAAMTGCDGHATATAPISTTAS